MSVLVVLGDLNVLEVKLHTTIYVRNKNFAASNRKATTSKKWLGEQNAKKKDHTDQEHIYCSSIQSHHIEDKFMW